MFVKIRIYMTFNWFLFKTAVLMWRIAGREMYQEALKCKHARQ